MSFILVYIIITGTVPPENISQELYQNKTLGIRYFGPRPDNFTVDISWPDGVDRSSDIERNYIPIKFGGNEWIYLLNLNSLSSEELRQSYIILYFDGREHRINPG